MVKTFPKFLERTPDELAEEAKVQDLRRASFSRARLTTEERLVGRGALLEETARGNLAAGDTEVSRSQLAEGMAMQGRYEEAAEHAPNAEMKAHFEAITAAIEMDDWEKCDCGDIEGNVDGVNVTITPRYVAKEVFSQKHGKVVSLVRCSICGHTNAREPRSRLLTQSSASRQNIAAANSGGRGMVRDSQLLKHG